MKYQITPTSNGVFLKMWEPAPVTETRHKPYDILVQRWLSSEAEAFQAIEEYISMQPDANSVAQPADDPRQISGVSRKYNLVSRSFAR
ncbi:MAG: hypothetical protein ACFE0I_02785 [Elainellaceae cyanobacterium]